MLNVPGVSGVPERVKVSELKFNPGTDALDSDQV
jgi:hypothetical protein